MIGGGVVRMGEMRVHKNLVGISESKKLLIRSNRA